MTTETQHNPNREEIEIGKIFAEMINLLEDTRKKQSESQKLNVEAKWHPVWVSAALLAGGAALARLFLT